MPKPTMTPMPNERIEAVWAVIKDRGLLKGVGDDLWDEIKDDIAAALQSPAPVFDATNLSDDDLVRLGKLWKDAKEPGTISVVQSPAGEWRSMESAPTDGTIIEGYGYSRIEKYRNGDVPDVRLIKAWGSGKGWSALNNHSWFTVGFYPTHWRPYSPPAPTGEV